MVCCDAQTYPMTFILEFLDPVLREVTYLTSANIIWLVVIPYARLSRGAVLARSNKNSMH